MEKNGASAIADSIASGKNLYPKIIIIHNNVTITTSILLNHTVKHVKNMLNIDFDIMPYINNTKVEDSYILQNGDTLIFQDIAFVNNKHRNIDDPWD